MQLKILTLLIPTLFLFSGCSLFEHEIKYIERKVYIKRDCPKMVILDPIQGYTIEDWKDYNLTHYIINKNQFSKFSNTCYKYKNHVEFYEDRR